jgi:hypothetical protein
MEGKTGKMGKKGKELIRRNFLITRLISDYLDLLNDLFSRQHGMRRAGNLVMQRSRATFIGDGSG